MRMKQSFFVLQINFAWFELSQYLKYEENVDIKKRSNALLQPLLTLNLIL